MTTAIQNKVELVAKSGWTMTIGRIGSPLPYDWDEAEMKLKEMSFDSEDDSEFDNEKFVQIVWRWGRRQFGKDAPKMPMKEIAEYWYAFVDDCP